MIIETIAIGTTPVSVKKLIEDVRGSEIRTRAPIEAVSFRTVGTVNIYASDYSTVSPALLLVPGEDQSDATLVPETLNAMLLSADAATTCSVFVAFKN